MSTTGNSHSSSASRPTPRYVRSNYSSRPSGSYSRPVKVHELSNLGRVVTPLEAENLRKGFYSSEQVSIPKLHDRAAEPGSSSRRAAIGPDGKEYMIPFESKDGNEERNIPLPPPPSKYDVSKEIRKQLDMDQVMLKQIRASFYAKSCFGNDEETPLPFNRQFVVLHFGTYCVNYEGAHPAEFAIASFSVRDGISQCFGRMLDTGEISFGYRAEFYEAAGTKGYELPGFDPEMDFGTGCLDIIQKFLEKTISDEDPHGTLYTARPDVDIVIDSLKYVAKKTGRAFNFKVFPLPRLIELLLIEGEHLRCLNKIEPSSIVYSEEKAIALMVCGRWNDFKELACRFHRCSSKLEYMEHCSMNLVKRWIYNSMELLTKLYCCPMFLHTHIPKLDTSPSYVIEKPVENPSIATLSESSFSSNAVRSVRTPTLASSVEGSRTGTIETNITRFIASEITSPRSYLSSAEEDSLSQSILSLNTTLPENTHEIYSEVEEEELLEESFVTFEVYPNLNTDVPLSTAQRAMEVFQMPHVGQRKFPPITEVFDFVQFIPGNSAAAIPLSTDSAQRQPLTILSLDNEFEKAPVSADFSFQRGKSQRWNLENDDAKSVSSGFSKVSFGSNVSGVSKSYRLPDPHADPLLEEGFQQAGKLLTQGVLPQTKFVYTGRLFWEDESFDEVNRPRPPQAHALPASPPPSPPGGVAVGNQIQGVAGRAFRHEEDVAAFPRLRVTSPAQGLGRARLAHDFWGRVQCGGSGRGRGGGGIALFSPDIAGLELTGSDDEEDEAISINTSMDGRRDLEYYERQSGLRNASESGSDIECESDSEKQNE